MPCMFCRSEADLTREHVFPAFMGGELTVPNGSCGRCNAEFGKWEAEIRDRTKFLLNLLQIENRNGEVPSVRVEVEIRGMDAKGLFGKREADGTISLSDVVVPSAEPDGKEHRHGFFVSQQSAERFIERARARGEKTTDLPLPKEIVYDATYTQTLPFAFSLSTRKVAAKIALAFIAYKYGVPYALSPQFDALRQVRTATTEKELPLRVFCNKTFMAAHTRNAHQHGVMCYLSAGKKKCWSLVTLFGGLSYVVEVTGNYEERSSRLFSIFYDAALKKPLNPVVLADEMAIIGEVLSKNSVFEDPRALDEQWFPIVEAYCADAGITDVLRCFLLDCLQCGLLLLCGCAYVFGIVGRKQSVKFVAGEFSSIQCAFPFWFKIKADPCVTGASKGRIYILGEGFIEAWQEKDADHYERIGRYPTPADGRTGLFVPDLGELFETIPHHGQQDAEILVYATK